LYLAGQLIAHSTLEVQPPVGWIQVQKATRQKSV
jgi:hypothetical protein